MDHNEETNIEKDLDDYTNDEIYDELLEEADTPSKSIH